MSVHNNYYTCYYNNDPTKFVRTDLYDKWNIHFHLDNIVRVPKTFKQEVLHTCELIYERFRSSTPKLNLFFSGGIDSEALLKCFVELKIPINPIVIIHSHDPTSPETRQALYICEKMRVDPTIINMDLHAMYARGLCTDIGIKYSTQRIAMIELLRAFEIISEPCIISDDVQLMYYSSSTNMISRNEISKQQWFYEIKEDIDGVFDRYEKITGIPVVADTLKYTPESWAAMIMTPQIKDIVINYRGKSSSNTTKNVMMSKEFGVPWREKTSVFDTGHYRKLADKLTRELSESILPTSIVPLEYTALLTILGIE